jgi:hypothetical protein
LSEQNAEATFESFYTQRHKLLRMFCHSRLSGILLLKKMPAIPDKPE